MKDKVDVLIIGSGASGAAVAWSLAETTDAHPVPGAGRLDEAVRLSDQRAGLRGAAVQRLRHQSEHPAAAERLSDQRRQLTDQGGELQRGRRLDRDVHGALSAPAPVRLPRPHAGRRGRRLADRLRDAGAVLRRERPHDRASRALPAIPPTRRTSRRCPLCRWASPAPRSRRR